MDATHTERGTKMKTYTIVKEYTQKSPRAKTLTPIYIIVVDGKEVMSFNTKRQAKEYAENM